CSVTYTPTAIGTGVHTITASYTGDSTHSGSGGTFALTVTKRTSATSVSCSPGSVLVGSATTCTATVSDTDAGTKSTPTGTVTFGSSGAAAVSTSGCTLPGSGASASCSVTYTPTAAGAGTHPITATYGGDTTHNGSSGTPT